MGFQFNFDLDLTKPPSEVLLEGFVPGDAMEFTGSVILPAGVNAKQLQFMSKARPKDTDNNGNTKVVTISDVSSAGGVFAQSGNLLTFRLTVRPSVSVAFTKKRFWSLSVWGQRGARIYPEAVAVGPMVPNKFATRSDPGTCETGIR